MEIVLNITNGDVAGDLLKAAGIPGEILIWRDILYDGRRIPGWPDEPALEARAAFLSKATGGGIGRTELRASLKAQYDRLAAVPDGGRVVLWFDACLYDMAMLCHVLACLRHLGRERADLICVDAFPGIEPFNGLGQLTPGQIASVGDRRRPVTRDQFRFAVDVDRAFAAQDVEFLAAFAHASTALLPWVPAAARRWLEELPDGETGLGRLERTALEAIRSGFTTPSEIFKAVAARETPPQYWGDTTLWEKINALADRRPPLVRIEGPAPRLPQWPGLGDIKAFRVVPVI